MNKNTAYLSEELETLIQLYVKKNLKQLLWSEWINLNSHNQEPFENLTASACSIVHTDTTDHFAEITQDFHTREIISTVTHALIGALEQSSSFTSSASLNKQENLYMDLLTWRNQPIRGQYAILYFEKFKIQMHGLTPQRKWLYFIVGVTAEGYREILDFHWLQDMKYTNCETIFRNIYNRGLHNILIGVFQGPSPFEDAFHEVYKQAEIQHSFTFRMKESLKKINKTDQEAFICDAKKIYNARAKENSNLLFGQFKNKWSKAAPHEMQIWLNEIDKLLAFFNYPQQIRCNLYHTNWMKQTIKELRNHYKIIPAHSSLQHIEQPMLQKVKEINMKWKTRRLKGFLKTAPILQSRLDQM